MVGEFWEEKLKTTLIHIIIILYLMNAIMKFSHRSSSFSQGDIYNRLLDMHDELSKSSRSLNNLIN